MARRRNKGEERRIAAARIRTLLDLARQAAHEGDDLAHRYAGLARRLAMRYQMPLRGAARSAVCRGCSGYRMPGRTARIRVTRGRIVTTCLRCGRIERRILHP